MANNRQELLQLLITRLSQAIKDMHAGQKFPFGEQEISRQQVMILFCLSEKSEGLAVKDLAKSLQVTPGAVTQFVDTLVSKKLVERTEGKKDRRLIDIKLSATAQKQFYHFKKNYLLTASRAFQDFSEMELKQFIALIAKIKPVNG